MSNIYILFIRFVYIVNTFIDAGRVSLLADLGLSRDNNRMAYGVLRSIFSYCNRFAIRLTNCRTHIILLFI